MRTSSLLRRLARAAIVPAVVAAATAVAATPAQAATLSPIAGFGSNPGNLNMYAYVPDDLPANAPLVVAMHGCDQSARDYFTNSGWRKFADQWKFALIFPEQRETNNSSECFNWFEPGDMRRGQGEAASIRNMVSYAIDAYGINPARVYVTGLSAGGAMAAVMMAAYPDVFAAGSVVAGVPYGCANSMSMAFMCMFIGFDKTPREWGDLVRSAYPGYAGPRPKVAIWHGTSDYVVVPMNATELRDQWTDVLGVSQTPTSTTSLPAGTTLETYGDDVVRLYRISGMGHGTPVDPGSGAGQCGIAGSYFIDTICSAYHDARYFGLDQPDDPNLPPAPGGLAVTDTTESSVSLSWHAVSDAIGYHVYRNGTRITSSPLTETTYTDSGLASGTTYSYAVSTVSSAGEGPRSASVSATTGGTTPVCETASNYAHVQAGRAYHSGGYVYARGSDQLMGLYNIFQITSLRQTGPDYWVVGC